MIFYTLATKTTDRSGYIEEGEFATYEEAYDKLCRTYVNEVSCDMEPTRFFILRHQIINWGEETNEMVHPVWG